jgi:hypothetical protein
MKSVVVLSCRALLVFCLWHTVGCSAGDGNRRTPETSDVPTSTANVGQGATKRVPLSAYQALVAEELRSQRVALEYFVRLRNSRRRWPDVLTS